MTATALRAPERVPPGGQPVAAIYHGTVRHRRRVDLPRDFTPRLFLAYLDVDALPGSLDSLPLWSARRAAPVRFRRRDFFDGDSGPLGPAVKDLVEHRLGRRPAGRVHLLAQLRTFGWLHNPLAVYYCWNGAGDRLDAIVLEVTNTPWGERCWYVLDATGAESAVRAKTMHVSPFLPMDMEYRVTWSTPGADLGLRIAVESAGRTMFEAELRLRRSALGARSAVGILVRYPLMTWRVSAAIYREAVRLFLGKAPRFRHPARGESMVSVANDKERVDG